MAKPRPPLPGGPYLVVGLARSGQAAAHLLAQRGDEVTGVDAGSPDGAEGLADAGVPVALNTDGLAQLEGAGCVVKSPGVPREAPVVAAALERGVPVIGELELAWRLIPNPFVAVTGTNGKTTVTELLGAIWRAADRPVAVAGNVGTPLASLVGHLAEDETIVCECSSFQLEDSEALAPECGVLLNVSPDHLDRHRTLDDYLRAKLRIFANQGTDDVAVVNGDEPALRDTDLGGQARRLAFCAGGGATACEVTIEAGAIVANGQPLLDISELRLLGAHNVANAMAAAVAALAMGVERDAVATGLRSFEGVPHRLERVAEIDGVLYVNDSKATNVAAAAAAIRSFDGGVHAILGGSSKGESFAALAEPISERCAACYLIGDTGGELDRDLAEAWATGVSHERCDDLEAAVRAASAAAGSGDVVLLAPACASFDAFRDFEDRGERFKALVGELFSGR
jgi:UDP-N-acetylmuramoylalanine--D-glutamate ligase